MAVKIFFDCGAPSIYNRLSRAKKNTYVMGTHMRHWGRDDFSYVDVPEYKAYRRAYLHFLQAEQPYLFAFSNLDVIHNAELTYKNQKWFEARGIKPLPVWHLGSDIAWLKRYIDEGYTYICMGGLVPNPVALLKPALDRVWGDTICNEKGIPRVKIHGFGLTSFDLMYRYPWYSTDSKSWTDYSRFGAILIPPRQMDGTYDWLHPQPIWVSDRVRQTSKGKVQFQFASNRTRHLVLKYLKHIKIPFGKTEYREVNKDHELEGTELWIQKPTTQKKGVVGVIVERGVRNHFNTRMGANLYVFKQIEKIVPEWPWAFKPQITIGEGRLL